MELRLPAKSLESGECVPAKTFHFDAGDLALFEFPYKNVSHTLVFGVAQDITVLHNAAALVLCPAFTLDEVTSLGGVPLSDFRPNRRYYDAKGRAEDIARRTYHSALIRDLHIGSAGEIAEALRAHWPGYEVYARTIEAMKRPYDWVRP